MLRRHILGFLVILCIVVLVEAFGAWLSLRGTILNTEPRSRMHYVLYVRLGEYMLFRFCLITTVLHLIWKKNSQVNLFHLEFANLHQNICFVWRGSVLWAIISKLSSDVKLRLLNYLCKCACSQYFASFLVLVFPATINQNYYILSSWYQNMDSLSSPQWELKGA